MGCKDKVKATCGGKTNAKCVKYEGDLSEYSKLEQCDCLDIEEVIEDLNSQIEDLNDKVDVSSLEGGCMTYGNSPTPASILQIHADKICELATKIDNENCTDCGSTQDCGTIVDCCGAVVVGLKYWSGDVTLPLTIGTWYTQTGTSLQHTITSGSGYYKFTIEHSVEFEDAIATMDVGIKINVATPTILSTGFDITRMKEVYTKTIILFMKLNQNDVITPVYKRVAAGTVQFDVIKLMIEKTSYIP